MTKIEMLNNTRNELAAKLAEVEKKLGIKTERVAMYKGGSRYSLAGPGDDEVVGYKEVTTYENPRYLEAWNAVKNQLREVNEELRNELGN